MTDILSNVEKGDIAVLRSGAMFQIAKLFICDDDYPVTIETLIGSGESYMMNGRCWEDRENPDDIVEVIKNPKGLDLIDAVREVFGA